MRLKVASRKSDLARWQAVQVARAFETLPEKPTSEFNFKASMGDQNLDVPLTQMGAKGVFTEDFYEDLVSGQSDLVVHSWKDLPVEERGETQIAMTLPRADSRDLLLVPEKVWELTEKTGRLTVLTSSPRRTYNLGMFLKGLLPISVELEFANVRGNVPTRLKKMHEQGHALVLAKAGLDRLLQAEDSGFFPPALREMVRSCRFMILPLSLNPGAPAQGALAVEVMRENVQLNSMCAKLNDEMTYKSVVEEREVLKRYGGGCQQKIGVTVLYREYGKVISLRGLTEQGEVLNNWRIENSTPWTRASSQENVFPLEARANSWFERETLTTSEDLSIKPALMISRAEALPQGFKPSPHQIVWTAGVRTWEKLAKQGVWVHGTHDSLGEAEPTGVETLHGAPLSWTKLSHQGGIGKPLIATYQLKNKLSHPDLTGKTHFFWMSSTAFERARQIFPGVINNGFNASGPGSTFEHIRAASGLKNPPKVFSGLAQFLADTIA